MFSLQLKRELQYKDLNALVSIRQFLDSFGKIKDRDPKIM